LRIANMNSSDTQGIRIISKGNTENVGSSGIDYPFPHNRNAAAFSSDGITR
jgi:hypothetical protein